MAIDTTQPDASTEHAAPTTLNPRVSIDPIVAEVHALREQQWQIYGQDTRAWFDALLLSQAQSAAKRLAAR